MQVASSEFRDPEVPENRLNCVHTGSRLWYEVTIRQAKCSLSTRSHAEQTTVNVKDKIPISVSAYQGTGYEYKHSSGRSQTLGVQEII